MNEIKKENQRYLKEQLITYIGNKRNLIQHIENEIIQIKNELSKEKLVCLDLFSGSGVVARMLKQHSSHIMANDLEGYSEVINNCYLSNKSEFDEVKFLNYLNILNERLNSVNLVKGIISDNYAPLDDENIQTSERVFYTTKNAQIIDTTREFINEIDSDYQKYFLGLLLHKSSVHTNTAGVFKGFYKDSNTGRGKFGGNGQNALKRIKGEISFQPPVLSDFNSEYSVFKEDANELVKRIDNLDVVYIDPPYNQHPYASNYFMLNVILNQKLNKSKISKVSGIPEDWNRSKYNKKKEALTAFDELISNVKAKYLLISYNSEGFISFEEMKEVLEKHGVVTTKEIEYNTYRGSRNLKDRELYVKEYIFKLMKEGA
jgi:adenine-specific DNA-methyltransferase